MFTVRCAGSQIVAFIEVPLARGAGAFGPQIGAMGPNWIGLPVYVHFVSLQLKDGIGPRVLPSHSSHPIAHPFENLKGKKECGR